MDSQANLDEHDAEIVSNETGKGCKLSLDLGGICEENGHIVVISSRQLGLAFELLIMLQFVIHPRRNIDRYLLAKSSKGGLLIEFGERVISSRAMKLILSLQSVSV